MEMYPEIINMTNSNVAAYHQTESMDYSVEIFGVLSGILLIVILHQNSKAKQFENSTYHKYAKIYSTLVLTYITFMLLFLPLVILTLSIFWVYRQLVNIILKLRYRSNFGGLLNGPDSFWMYPDDSTNIITTLLLVNNDSCTHKENLLDVISERLEVLLSQKEYYKMRCTASTFYGYSFLIKDKFTIDDCVKVLDENKYKDESTLRQTLSEAASNELPTLWDISVGNKPMQWGNKSNNRPILIRFNHCLGDGLALLQLLLSCFKDDKRIVCQDPEKDDFMQAMVRVSIRCMHFLVVLFNLPLLVAGKMSMKVDKSLLHGRKLSGQKIIAWRTEESRKYVRVVKNIKHRLTGAGFFDVVATALSASLRNFLRERGDDAESMEAVVPVIPNSLKFKNLDTFKESFSLSNSYSVGVLELPIKRNGGEKYNILDRYCDIRNRTFQLKTSYEYQVNYWILNIAACVLPAQIIGRVINSMESTMVVTNLPGPRKVTLFGDHALEDLVFWVPHRGLTGVTISIFTYDDRFQLGISVDKVYGITSKNAEVILDGVFKYLDYLDYEALFY